MSIRLLLTLICALALTILPGGVGFAVAAPVAAGHCAAMSGSDDMAHDQDSDSEDASACRSACAANAVAVSSTPTVIVPLLPSAPAGTRILPRTGREPPYPTPPPRAA